MESRGKSAKNRLLIPAQFGLTVLAKYLATVKTIYAFQLLSGTDVKNGWEILHKLQEAIHTQVGGILQAGPTH
jgi:hypothetical protein